MKSLALSKIHVTVGEEVSAVHYMRLHLRSLITLQLRLRLGGAVVQVWSHQTTGTVRMITVWVERQSQQPVHSHTVEGRGSDQAWAGCLVFSSVRRAGRVTDVLLKAIQRSHWLMWEALLPWVQLKSEEHLWHWWENTAFLILLGAT